MITSIVEIDNTKWTQVSTQTDFVVQNISASTIYMSVSDTTPTDDVGMVINPKKGLDSNFITGTVWARSLNGTAHVTSTE